MALFPKTPGVYIQEIKTLAPSVVPVPTAIPVFIGYTESGTLNKPTRIGSLLDYQEKFGGAYNVALNADDTVTASVWKVSLTTPLTPEFRLYYHLQMYFGNGGGPCYIISVGDYTAAAIDGPDLLAAVPLAEQVDEITLLVVPEAIAPDVLDIDRLAIYDAMLMQCSRLQDRFSILDVPVRGGTIADDATDFRTLNVGANHLKYGAAYYPSFDSGVSYSYDDADVSILSAGPYGGLTLADLLPGGSNPDMITYNQITSAIASSSMILYPSATMAGVYAAVDNDRGVWKAPANVSLTLVDSLSVVIDNVDQDGLNVDATSGKSINAIRNFNGRGILVWGARTLDGNSNEWRYVSVRRLFIMAEESCKKASEFVVFEPNDKNTWVTVKSMISNFLTNLWRDGALAGEKPEHAFFVKVGLNETMTAQDILEGKLIVQIGLAAVRPAEFIILEFMHKLQEA